MPFETEKRVFCHLAFEMSLIVACGLQIEVDVNPNIILGLAKSQRNKRQDIKVYKDCYLQNGFMQYPTSR